MGSAVLAIACMWVCDNQSSLTLALSPFPFFYACKPQKWDSNFSLSFDGSTAATAISWLCRLDEISTMHSLLFAPNHRNLQQSSMTRGPTCKHKHRFDS